MRGLRSTRGVLGALLTVASAWLFAPAPAAAADLGPGFETLGGQVLYVDFWASWCVPCRLSFPWMQAMQDTYRSKGFTVIAVNLDQDRRDAARFLSVFHPTFEIRFDPKADLAERFKVEGMPTGVLIDRHGNVRYTHIGFRPVDRAQYESQIRLLLNEPE